MKQIMLTNEQAEQLRELLICSKSYRIGEIAFWEAIHDNKRAEPFRRMDQMANEVIPLLHRGI